MLLVSAIANLAISYLISYGLPLVELLLLQCTDKGLQDPITKQTNKQKSNRPEKNEWMECYEWLLAVAVKSTG